jgi:microcystin-dependent protein
MVSSYPFIRKDMVLGGYRVIKNKWGESTMEAFLGQVIMFAGAKAPEGWHVCDGSLLNINGNEALYSLIGTTYGGDGIKTFGLPDLRGRIPIGAGQGAGLTPRTLGQSGGSVTAGVNIAQFPVHTHPFYATSATATSVVPTNMVCAQNTAVTHYADTVSGAMQFKFNAKALTDAVGGWQQHANVMPSMSINFIICLSGLYPVPD